MPPPGASAALSSTFGSVPTGTIFVLFWVSRRSAWCDGSGWFWLLAVAVEAVAVVVAVAVAVGVGVAVVVVVAFDISHSYV